MAKEKSRGDLTRRSRSREQQHEIHRKSWVTKNKPDRRDVYGDPIVAGEGRRPPVDGRRLADDLRRISNLTEDPAFEYAAKVLSSYGLDRGSPMRSARAIAEAKAETRWLDDLDGALEFMEREKHECERQGRRFSARKSAERLVDEFNLPGTSFESAVDDLRRKFKGFERTGKFRRDGAAFPSGDVGTHFLSVPIDAVGATSPILIADDRMNRQRFFAGKLVVRVLGEKYPPKKSQ